MTDIEKFIRTRFFDEMSIQNIFDMVDDYYCEQNIKGKKLVVCLGTMFNEYGGGFDIDADIYERDLTDALRDMSVVICGCDIYDDEFAVFVTPVKKARRWLVDD